MKFDRNDEMAFAVRKNGEWELHELIGKGGKVVKCNYALSKYRIEIGGV